MLAKAPAGIVAPVPAPVPAPVAPVPTGRQGAANAPWKLLGFSAVAFQMRHWYSPRRLHMRRALPASSKPQPEGPSQTRRKTLTAGIGCLGAYGYQTRSEASDSRLIYHITEETLPSKVNLPTEAFLRWPWYVFVWFWFCVDPCHSFVEMRLQRLERTVCSFVIVSRGGKIPS